MMEEGELSMSKTGSESSQFRRDKNECQKLLREARALELKAEKLRSEWQERSNADESSGQVRDDISLEEVEIAEAKAYDAYNKAKQFAQTDTELGHMIKLSRGNTELLKLLENYFKESSKKPRGPGEYCFKAGMSVCGAKFLTQHGGNDLTTDNGMDVIDQFEKITSYAVKAYSEESEEGRQIREFLVLCRKLAEDLAELLVFMKSQKKCSHTDFLNKLDKFLKSWDAALPHNYFLKLHHLIHHVVEFILRYGMYGRVSAESFEAIHTLISKLKTMSRSQTTLNRIKTTCGKAQTIMKPGVMSATDEYNKRSTGKKRGPYKIKPSTQSAEAAESFDAYNVVTVQNIEYIDVLAGEARVLKEYGDYWRLLTTTFTPPAWGEQFQSSTTIPQEKKRKITSGAELNL